MLSAALTAFACVLTFCAGSLAAFPNPLTLTGDSFFVHDPSLVQRASDGKYFLFTTHNKGGIITATNLAGYVVVTPEVATRLTLFLGHGHQWDPSSQTTLLST